MELSTQRKGCLFQVVYSRKAAAHRAVSGDPDRTLTFRKSPGAPMGVMDVDFVLLLLEYRLTRARTYSVGATTLRTARTWSKLVTEAPVSPDG